MQAVLRTVNLQIMIRLWCDSIDAVKTTAASRAVAELNGTIVAGAGMSFNGIFTIRWTIQSTVGLG